MSDKPFIPVIQKTSILIIMALVSIVAFSVAFFSREVIISSSYDMKINAAMQMKKAMAMLKDIRMEKGVFVDIENDPNETGLVGTQFSLITTDEGDLDAKLTTMDPNFRNLLKIIFENKKNEIKKTEILISSLMGKNPELDP